MTSRTSRAARRTGRPGRERAELALLTGMLLIVVGSVARAETGGAGAALAYSFDDTFMMGRSGRHVDLSRFAYGNPVAKGIHRADVYVNDSWLGRFDVDVNQGSAHGAPTLCFNRDLWNRLNLAPEQLDDAVVAWLTGDANGTRLAGASCLVLTEQVPETGNTFDPGELRVDIQLPQALQRRRMRFHAPPAMWDDGATAATLSYDIGSLWSSDGFGANTSQYFGTLRAQGNLGAWRFVHRGAFYGGQNLSTSYRDFGNYATRALPDWGARLTLGDSATSGALFHSFSVRGVKIDTDARMLPDNQRNYSPVVRGAARTPAKVEIRQGNVLVYQQLVPAGPFVIDDGIPTGLGGDLEVTLIEADGQKTIWRVPYSPTPLSLPKGATRVEWAAGVLKDAPSHRPVTMGTLQYGVTANLTANVGAILADQYQAGMLGAALSSPWGAWSLDATGSMTDSSSAGPGRSGTSLSLGWSKFFEATETTVALAGSRYSSEYYYDLIDADRIMTESPTTTQVPRERSRVALTATQRLGRLGSMYVSASRRTYWTSTDNDTSVQLGYSFNVGSATVNVSYARDRWAFGGTNQHQASVSVSIPLGFTPTHRGTLVAQARSDLDGRESYRVGAGASFGDQFQYSYQVGANQNAGRSSADASVQAATSMGTWRASGSAGQHWHSASLGATGGIVLHRGGVTLAPFLGDTIGLVQVPGGQGSTIQGVAGSGVDANGYTVAPYLAPYEVNNVELNLSGAPLDLELDSVTQTAVPTAGAVIPLNYTRKTGRLVSFRVRTPSGKRPPFAAAVTDEQDQPVGTVGQAGRVEARLQKLDGVLSIQMGSAAAPQVCRIHYSLPKLDADRHTDAIETYDVECKN